MMNREVTKMKKLEKGFTLIELMIVVAIIAILAAVAAPKMASQLKKAKDAKALAVLGSARSASSIYYADHDGVYTTAMGDIYDLVDAGAQRVFVTSGSSATLLAGTSTDGATTQVAITLVGSTDVPFATSAGSINYTEGEVYLGGAAADLDTKGKNWVLY